MKVPKAKMRLIELGLLLAYRALLDVVYVLFVNPWYEYAGFILRPNSLKLVESYFFLVLLLFLLPSGERKPSSAGMKYLFILTIAPLLSLYALKDEPRVFMYLALSGFCLTLSVVRLLPGIRIKKIEKSTPVLFICLGVFSFVVYAAFIGINGLPTLRALRLSLVYEVRGTVNYGHRIMGYVVPWQAKVVNPFLIILTYHKRKYLSLLMVLGLQLLLFLMTGAKSYLFSPLLCLFLVYAIERQRMFRLSLMGATAAILLSFVAYMASGPMIIPSMFIRRVFFVPAAISFEYYDFFSENELMHLSESRLGKPFFENPYESYNMSSANMMGMIYGGNPQTHKNTGYISSAYMNFGALGVWLFSLMLAIILSISDSVAKNTNKVVATAAIVLSVRTLVDGGLFTTMLTHGFLATIFVVWLYKDRSRRIGLMRIRQVK
ncbi:hypothetical protein ACFL6S_19730 [Candidatus Poribacteria bacterium]